MPATPATSPGCAGLPAQAPTSSLPGFKGPPRRLDARRPAWVVRTESNVRRERPKRPDPPCTICKGTGTINCRNCFGRGLYFTPMMFSLASMLIRTISSHENRA
uniref:Uncharacterized protein n=1 Tax=Aegilops tauschii subsp. strangulata TaxID=200361 RepID=A0A453CXA2_AEGTS